MPVSVKDIIRRLPNPVKAGPNLEKLIEIISAQLNKLLDTVEQVREQREIGKATFSLSRWERDLGITPPAGQPDEERRSVILAKLRGIGTVTRDMIKTVAESFVNGEVEVIEYAINKIPPFTDSAWMLHENVVIDGPYTAMLHATGPDQESHIILQLQKNTTYTLSFGASGNTSMGMGITSDIQVSVTSADGGKTFIPYGGGPMTFNTGGNDEVRISFRNAPGFTGVATIRNPQLEHGVNPTDFLPQKPYTVGIKFVSQLGIPPNLEDIQRAIREILPAHLAVEFIFSYITFGELEERGLKFGDIESAGLTFGELQSWNI